MADQLGAFFFQAHGNQKYSPAIHDNVFLVVLNVGLLESILNILMGSEVIESSYCAVIAQGAELG